MNNRRWILATSTGHPSRWKNNKTLVLFESFVVALLEGPILVDAEFELYERAADSTIEKVKYKGTWLIMDNRYLNWPTAVPPIKTSCSCTDIRLSKSLESVRKDVECVFRMLKGQF